MIRIVLQLIAIGVISGAGALAVRAWHPKSPPLYFYADQVKEGEATLEQALEWQAADEILWIDARPREKYEAGHIDGAVLLNEQDDFNMLLMESIDVLQNNAHKRLVIYCATDICAASKRVAELLRDRGFPDVYALHGGEEALRQAGLLR